MTVDLGRPIRVVYFGGPYLQPGAVRFAALLEEHPDVDLVLGLCEGEGQGLRHRWRNLWKRRGFLAPIVLMLDLLAEMWEFALAPADNLRIRRIARRALPRFETVADVHAPEIIERVRELAPDLGVIYGAPILKPELFTLPRLGTLGIHHGRVPKYRGKKTTFWEMYHGEPAAGITIQRVNAGIDTGEVIATGEVPIGRKSYGRVWREVERVGGDLYLQSVLDFKRGTARPLASTEKVPRARLFRQPTPADILKLWWSRLLRRPPPGTTS